jgi:hypothetical protein
VTNENRKVMDGTLIQGADGSLYFIPTEDLQAFRLPDDAPADEGPGQDDVAGHLYQSIFAVQGPVAYQTFRNPGIAFGPTLVPTGALNLGGYQR